MAQALASLPNLATLSMPSWRIDRTASQCENSYQTQRPLLAAALAKAAAATYRPAPTLIADGNEEFPTAFYPAFEAVRTRVRDLGSLRAPAALHPDADADSWGVE